MPALLLFGQWDPMRLLGRVPRYRKLLPEASVTIIPRERHFPMLGAGASVGEAIAAFVGGAT